MGSKKAATMLVSTGGGSRSLRTTIPMWIVEHFDLSAGDIIKLQAYADISSGGTWNVNQNSLSASRCYFLGYKIGA